MKAHYTKFETEEQFKKLVAKAVKLGMVNIGPAGKSLYFGYDKGDRLFNTYFRSNYLTGAPVFNGTYLPYEQYLDYLDKCIENAKK